MNNDHLPEGTLLDERYQIREVLGEGGFGITYAAWNQRIRRKVAVKELFWREHVYREPDSPVLFVPREEERTDYEALKEKFMREARLLRDFDREPGVVQVLDYFEANNTAYLVMEYLEGVTFRRYMKLHGVFGAEDLFRRLLPLLESLCPYPSGRCDPPGHQSGQHYDPGGRQPEAAGFWGQPEIIKARRTDGIRPLSGKITHLANSLTATAVRGHGRMCMRLAPPFTKVSPDRRRRALFRGCFWMN